MKTFLKSATDYANSHGFLSQIKVVFILVSEILAIKFFESNKKIHEENLRKSVQSVAKRDVLFYRNVIKR
jgi:hypothetical protein